MPAQKLISVFCRFCIIAFTVHCVTPSTPPPVATAPRVTLHSDTDSVTLDVEVANDPASRERGLMYRKAMPQDRGMIFLFTDEVVRSFWMKNTYLPLDIIFINSARQVAGVVHHAEPFTTTPRGVPAPSQFVLEVNAGLAKRLGVAPGTAVTFAGLPEPHP